MPRIVVRTVFLALVFAGSATAQVKNNVPDIVPGARPVPVEHIKVHGASLEGNLEGDAADRDVLVFLPPSYAADRNRRYPVVYALHGYFIGAEQWSKELHVPQTIEGAFAKGAKDMISIYCNNNPDTQIFSGKGLILGGSTTAINPSLPSSRKLTP